jgi:peptidoglycan/LPS O-acetylase OafA/YrhL
VKPKRVNIAIALGKRSFCLYAFHYPVLLVFNYFLDPSTVGQFVLYCVLSIASTAIVSELSFRLLDLPSISASQRRD